MHLQSRLRAAYILVRLGSKELEADSTDLKCSPQQHSKGKPAAMVSAMKSLVVVIMLSLVGRLCSYYIIHLEVLARGSSLRV